MLWLIILVIMLSRSVVQGAELPTTQTKRPGTEIALSNSQDTASAVRKVESEVVSFRLQGKKPYQSLNIDDMDVVLVDSNRRLLPLFRILNALQVKPTISGSVITFQVEGSPKTDLNISTKEMSVGGHPKPIELIESVSIITKERDVYLPPEAIGEVIAAVIKWDDTLYAYVGRTNNDLSIWDFAGTSSSKTQTNFASVNLPELFPPALPSNTSLDFMQMRLRSNTALADPSNPTRRWGLDNPELTLWGGLAKGQYRLGLLSP